MSYDLSLFKKNLGETEEWLSREFATIRTGRATPAILDGTTVDSYGAQVAVSHVAGITIEDARSLRVTPWDKGQIKAIEKAVNDADLGVSVVVDNDGLRVIFPELTAERREALKKIAHKKHEDARVSLRQARDDVWSDIQKQEKDGVLSEDEKFRLKDELQKMMDEANKKLDEMLTKKEQEISV